MPRRIEFPLIEIHADEFHRQLTARAIELSNMLLRCIIQQNLEFEKTYIFQNLTISICARYEEIEEKALRTPEGFKEMSDLMEYMELVHVQLLPALKSELHEAHRRMMYAIKFSALSEESIRWNTVTFNWQYQIIPILDKHKLMLNIAKENSMENLKERRAKFEQEMEELRAQVEQLKEVGEYDETPFYHKKTQNMLKQLQGAVEIIATFNKEEQLFQWPNSAYPMRKQIQSALEPFITLYGIATNFHKCYKKWMDGSILELDAEEIEVEVDSLKRDIFKISATMNDLKAPQNIIKYIKEKIEEFSLNFPAIRILCNPGLRNRHWEKMESVAGFEIKPDASTSLKKMLKLNIDTFLSFFLEVSESASKEFTLEKTLIKMKSDWAPFLFTLLAYRETGTFIVAGMDDIQQLLDDQIVKTQSMRSSPYIQPFEVEIKDWEKTLVTTQDIIDGWLKVQATWLYLEPIFSSEDIMKQMPEEGKKFKLVDQRWRQMMIKINEDPHVLMVSEIPNIVAELDESAQLLEEILKGLNSYLEVKRLFFPRFFFLSNDEMLEILSETKDPTRVQPHLKKCFEGVASLEFDSKLDILSLYSSEKERLPLTARISTAAAKGSVEKWLSEVILNYSF
jgi:dynein heavy chain